MQRGGGWGVSRTAWEAGGRTTARALVPAAAHSAPCCGRGCSAWLHAAPQAGGQPCCPAAIQPCPRACSRCCSTSRAQRSSVAAWSASSSATLVASINPSGPPYSLHTWQSGAGERGRGGQPHGWLRCGPPAALQAAAVQGWRRRRHTLRRVPPRCPAHPVSVHHCIDLQVHGAVQEMKLLRLRQRQQGRLVVKRCGQGSGVPGTKVGRGMVQPAAGANRSGRLAPADWHSLAAGRSGCRATAATAWRAPLRGSGRRRPQPAGLQCAHRPLARRRCHVGPNLRQAEGVDNRLAVER